jgi:hypothetical protein
MLTTPLFLILIAVVVGVIFFGLFRNRDQNKNAGVTNEGRTIHHSPNPEAAAKTDTDFPAMDQNSNTNSSAGNINQERNGQGMRE